MEENRVVATRCNAQGIPSTQDITARYPTPPGETPGSKKKRNNRKRTAVSRMRKKRRLDMELNATDVQENTVRDDELPDAVPQHMGVEAAVNEVVVEAVPANVHMDTTGDEGGTEVVRVSMGRMHIEHESKTEEYDPAVIHAEYDRGRTHIAQESKTEESDPAVIRAQYDRGQSRQIVSPSFIARYATPPDETGSAKKKRKDRRRKAASRRRQTLEERHDIQLRDQERHAARRIQMHDDERAVIRENDQEWRASQRAQLEEEDISRVRADNSQRMMRHRAAMNEEEAEEERQINREQHQQSRLNRPSGLLGVALFHYDGYDQDDISGGDIEDGRHQLGRRTIVCDHCKAVKWRKETANCCCLGGAVVLAPPNQPPEVLSALFDEPHFRQNIRAFNSVFAFTSLGADLGETPAFDEALANGRQGTYTLRLQGAMIHQIGRLCPREQQLPKFAQIYFFDSDLEQQVQRRSNIMASLDPAMLRALQQMMNDHNPFAQQFITAGQKARLQNEDGITENVTLHIHETHNVDLRTHNRPTANEVAGIFVSTSEAVLGRDLILHQHTGGLMRVFEWWGSYDPLQYPLLYPFGEYGWSDAIGYREGSTRQRNRVSALEFAAYRLYDKSGENSLLHRAARLLQQWCVDQYAKVEQQRLKFQQANQKKLRGDIFNGILDMMVGDELLRSFVNIGKKIVLSSSFTAGPRDFLEKYYQAMTIVREVSHPHLFITQTTNPQWKEIQDELREGESAQDRPDLVARVFKLKMEKLMKLLTKDMIFGRVIGYISVIEFQKRGLPHVHILLMLHADDVPKTPADFDKFVSAEIPDSRTHPLLFQTVKSSMIHGPCGRGFEDAPCMKDGKCQKRYPRPFAENTVSDRVGYPLYQRRNIRTQYNQVYKKGRLMGNQWVIPYNPYLSQVMNCHINVEICSTITAVKYLFKYVYKGSDRAVVTVGAERNEIEEYLNARYVSASESCWRLFRYPLTSRSHTVMPLPIHRPNMQWVTFRESDRWEEVVEHAKKTELTEFFKLCSTDPEASNLLYQDVPKFYTWDKQNHKWCRRQRGGDKALGRVVNCPPSDIERFHLRMMLCYRRGPTSFEDLRTVEGRVYATFHDAAYAAGYLLDDTEYVKAMAESAQYAMPRQLRSLFATIIAHCTVSRVRDLWDKFTEEMSADFTHMRGGDAISTIGMRWVMYKVLEDVDKQLRSSSSPLNNLASFPSLPQLSEYDDVAEATFSTHRNTLMAAERYTDDELARTTRLLSMLNEQQRAIYDEVTASVFNDTALSKLFYLDGPGGTGKTFVIEQILAYVRSKKSIALAVATSGIAALLLTGGRTAHSRFKVPITGLDETSTCNVRRGTQLGELLSDAKFIVFDEAPMAHRHVVECIDRTLRDICGKDHPFGGITVLFAGDFRQTLPIIPKGTCAEVIGACLMKSTLWSQMKLLSLSVNERLRQQERNGAPVDQVEAAKRHADFILSVGEGNHPVHNDLGPGFVKIPKDMLMNADDNSQPVRKLIEHVYGDINSQSDSNEYFANKAILAPKNTNVHSLNMEVLNKVEGPERVYRSMDTVHEDDDDTLYPVEYLNCLQYTGLPLHEMRLKVGASVMLMRNLSSPQGMCNGTRLRIKMMTDNCLFAQIMTGPCKNDDVLIPRVTIEHTDTQLPFKLRRRQFPVQLAFAMTINKAQGQSLQNIGLFLPEPVFGHGQLYVALSRSTTKDGLKILILNPALQEPDGVWTANVVYKQIFL